MGEQTSLARQLQKLAAPQTSLLFQHKTRASLLFDPKEATSLDRDTIFAYGSTGFDKLLMINNAFKRFEEILFSENSKTFERSVQDNDTNKRLDEQINNFLSMISPYVLLRAAHEALEWLLYRYHIHMFNTDALVACVLPHYHTRIFVRVIQLLDLTSETNRWCWMSHIQKSGKPLELSTLLKQFNSNSGFRKFVCDLATNIFKLYAKDPASGQIVIAFSTIMTYYAVNQLPLIDESYIMFLLPYLVQGLKSKCLTYTNGAYLIISGLIVKIKFSGSLLTRLCLQIFENLIPNSSRTALEMLILIFQRQNIKKLPKKISTKICSDPDIALQFQQLIAEYHDTTFSMSVIRKSIAVVFKEVNAKGKSEKETFVSSVLSLGTLGEKNLLSCFNAILKSYVKYREKRKKKNAGSLMKTGKVLLKSLEICGSETFDNSIKAYFNSKKISENDKRHVLNLINETVGYVRHHIVSDSGLTLFLALNHPVSTIRENATKIVLKLLKSKKVNDMEYIKNVLLERLCDDDVQVVLQVLSLGEKLFDILPHDKLLSSLFSALQLYVWKNMPRRSKVISAVLKIICSKPLTNITEKKNLEYFTGILPLLLPLIPDDMVYLPLILQSPMASSHPFLTVLQIDCLPLIKSNKSVTKLNLSVLYSLEKVVNSMNVEQQNIILKHLLHHQDISECDGRILLFTIFFVKAIYFSKTCMDKEKVMLLSLFRQYLEVVLHSNRLSNPNYHTDADLDSVFTNCILHLRKNLLSLPIICFILHLIIKDLQIAETDKNGWHPCEDESYISYIDLFVFLLKYCNFDAYGASFKLLLGMFIQQTFPNRKNFLWFLSYFWSKSNDFGHDFQLAGLKIASAVCKEERSLAWFYEDSVMLPSLLVALKNNDDVLRLSYLKFLTESLLPKMADCTSPFKAFLDVIGSHVEEIQSDETYLKQLIADWLIPNNSTMSAPDKCASKHVLENLLLHVCNVDTPHSVRYVILHFLQNANSPALLTRFLPALKHHMKRYENSTHPLSTEELNIISMLLQKFNAASVEILKENSDELNIYLSCLKVCVVYDTGKDTFVQEMALQTVSKNLFSSLPSVTVQRLVFNALLEMYTNAEWTKVNAAVGKALRKICIYSYLLLKELPGNVMVVPNDVSLKDIKKSKKQMSDSLPVPEDVAWKKISVLLEITQSKDSLLEKEALLCELFRLLNLTLDWESSLSGEYARQLILANIYNCCSQFEPKELPDSKFHVEFIIQCIRSSQNPKTHHQALLTLNLAAVLFPEHVLNNIMSIFTFMGTNLVRQDDSYSFQIIYQTIETIVPALLEASNQANSSDTFHVMSSIIRLFVNSIPDIPPHRQFPLFSKLISTLGPSNYLWILVAQISECHLSKFSQDMRSVEEESQSIRELSASLHEQFPLEIQLQSCLNLLQHLRCLPVVIDEKTRKSKTKFEEPFDISTHTNDQLQTYKKDLLRYMNQRLSSIAFITLACESENQCANDSEASYKAVLEETLAYLQIVTDAQKNSESYRPHLVLAYELLQTINSLLPSKLFTRVIKKLLSSDIFDIRLKAIEMLSAKLEQQPKFFLRDGTGGLLKLLKPLVKVFDVESATSDPNITEKQELIQQTALFSLHLMCKICGSDNSMKFHKVLSIIVNIVCNPKERSRLTVNALLCFAELCKSLNALILPHLNAFMPHLLSLMCSYKEFSDNEYLILAAVIVLRELIVHLGGFLNSYMYSVLTRLCTSIVNCEISSKRVLQESFSSVCDAIASEIDLRVLLPAAEKCYREHSLDKSSAVKPLVEIVSMKISKINSSDLLLSVSSLQMFFLDLLGFRSEATHDSSFVDSVEGSIIESTLSLVMKMSEPMFQTFFNQIYSWAIPCDGDSSENKHNIFTFYRLTRELAKNLKTLFVAFAKKFLRHCVSMMGNNNISKTEFSLVEKCTATSFELLNNVIDTLTFCFQNDDGQLAEKDYFDVLMQPLVDQIDNTLGDDKLYQDRIDNHLSDCLAHFITLFSDNALWKSMNYQLLLKTRHSSPKVRFAALQVIRKVVRQMGEHYLVLLPESIPFLAEIMEDESFEVEQECQDVIIEMEKILGEPIKKYF